MDLRSVFCGDNSIVTQVGSTTIINGKVISTNGGNICVKNGVAYVNGKRVEDGDFSNDPVINVEITGNCDSVKCNGSVTVKGNCGKIDAGSSIEISGDVTGNVDAGSSVTIGGSVDGDIDAGSSVEVKGSVSGDIDAGGSVRVGK